MTHEHSEECKEDKQQGKAEEHNTHCHHGDTEAVGVFALELGDLCLLNCGIVGDSRCYHVVGLNVPFRTAISMTGIRLVDCHDGHGDRVDQIDTITIV